jgi:tetratricopeptide (TPR) repeat protein
MDRQTRNILIGIVGLVIVVVLGYFVWKERGNAASIVQVPAASSTPIAIPVSISTAATSTNPAYTITAIPGAKPGVAAPDFTLPLVFSSSVSPDTQASLEAAFAQVQSALKKNATDFDSWIALGDLRKEAGDYAGAAADWEYASEAYPGNIISFANLGDLYSHFLPNYPKAAAAYKQQIANDPTDVEIYQDLFLLYTNQYPQAAGVAETLVKQGIAANPKAVDLQVLLARYYKSQGDTADAKAEYDAAIANAQAQGQTSVAAQLQAEEAAL